MQQRIPAKHNRAPIAMTSICLMIFLMSLLLPSFPEDLVPIFLGCAFIGTIGLALSQTSGERVMSFLATAASLLIASCLWNAGVNHLQSHAKFWKNVALNDTLTSAKPATSRPTTKP